MGLKTDLMSCLDENLYEVAFRTVKFWRHCRGSNF